MDRNQKPKLPFGPALLVTAAFIGPGTLTTASQAGAGYGYTLVWAVMASVIAAIILQEMAARLGIVTGGDLTRAIRQNFASPIARWSILGLVLVAILFGNAAYQTGNILGAAAGLNTLSGVGINIWILTIGAIAMLVVWIGRFASAD